MNAMTKTTTPSKFNLQAVQSRLASLPDAFVLEKSTAHAMQQWLRECCVFTDQATACSDLYAHWLKWAHAHDHYQSTPRRLGMAMRHLGMKPCIINSGRTRAYRGIAFATEAV